MEKPDPNAYDALPLDQLASPARRALAAAGIDTLSDLSGWTEAQLLSLDGIGPNALGTLRGALEEAGRGFAAGGG